MKWSILSNKLIGNGLSGGMHKSAEKFINIAITKGKTFFNEINNILHCYYFRFRWYFCNGTGIR